MRLSRPLATAMTAGSVIVLGFGTPAHADPAPTPSAFTAGVGSFTDVVPEGVCAVQATVVGGSGGSSIAAPNTNGSGARVQATFPVLPFQPFSGSVGGGGGAGGAAPGGANGGTNGGGNGGTIVGNHAGAGGGGWSELQVAGIPMIVAGGGGGSAGGHSTTQGLGGNAGLPTATGVTAGNAGTQGVDTPGNGTPGGGSGGGTAGAGAGGVHSTNSALNGSSGVGRTGGNGGADPNFDSSAGGGGGYYGAGGGASTVGQYANAELISGGGGGGGSSFVAATVPTGSGAAPTAVSSTAGPKLPGTGAGANGSVTLNWLPCNYDLAVTKSVMPTVVASGQTVTWTVTVSNVGSAPMTSGDLLTLTDTRPGTGAKTITGITTSGGSNDLLQRGPVTCDAAVGSPMPATLTCSRAYAAKPGVPGGPFLPAARGIDPGESLTVTYTQVLSDAPGDLANTATVTDRTTGDSNDSAQATVTIAAAPDAANDSDLGNTIGDPVTVPVLGNDTGDLDPGTVRILEPGTGDPLTALAVPGQGTWNVNASSGAITFTPLPTFLGDPAPITYRVADTLGQTASATVTVTYVPTATDDSDMGNTIGDPVTVDVLANDTGDFDPTTVRIVSGGNRVTTLTVPGQGTWTVNPTTGALTFTPEPGFEGDPTAVDYEVTDTTGDTVDATVTVTYVPAAADDSDSGNTIGDPVTVDVLANDTGDFDPTTVRIVSGGNRVTTLTVPGQGTWTVNPTTGALTFTPEPGFEGDPTAVDYEVTDTTGDTVDATVTVTYVPAAADDSDSGNTIGDPVTVDVLANDTGDFDPTTVRIVSGGNRVTTLTVPGQGTWTVNPTTGALTFTPEPGFEGDPTAVDYEVTDTTGDTVGATVTVLYVPAATDDFDYANTIGEPVTVDPLANDSGSFDATSVRIVTTGGDRVTTLTVPGEGTWTVNTTTGRVTFTPEAGFEGDPSPVDYEVTDTTGDTVGATITVTYVPAAADDTDTGNTIGDTVTVDVLGNDTGDFDPSTVRIIDPDTGDFVTELVVDGEGTWTVDPTTGAITFTPERGFTGDPAAVSYRVTDTTGDTVSADVTVTYLPQATSDSSKGNKVGEPVTVDVLGNDTGVFDPGTVRIITPGTGVPVTKLAVPGEGTWTVDPDTGAITFTPERGFTGDPTPITYQVADMSGDVTTAEVSVDYVQPTPATPPAVTPPASAAPADDPDGLAWTGFNPAGPAGLAAALLIAGAGLLIARRRWAAQR